MTTVTGVTLFSEYPAAFIGTVGAPPVVGGEVIRFPRALVEGDPLDAVLYDPDIAAAM
ncbi:MAG: hypothetical protein HPY83_19545 [Anaerolineae bacterium]|nr:hypothetical protein [Anaerolineae bacterium]